MMKKTLIKTTAAMALLAALVLQSCAPTHTHSTLVVKPQAKPKKKVVVVKKAHPRSAKRVIVVTR